MKNTDILFLNELNQCKVVSWSKPVKIKELWYNAVLQHPKPTKQSNIQFIMKCNLAYTETKETSYIVVSRDPMTLEEINNIRLDNFIFDNQKHFSRGVELI